MITFVPSNTDTQLPADLVSTTRTPHTHSCVEMNPEVSCLMPARSTHGCVAPTAPLLAQTTDGFRIVSSSGATTTGLARLSSSAHQPVLDSKTLPAFRGVPWLLLPTVSTRHCSRLTRAWTHAQTHALEPRTLLPLLLLLLAATLPEDCTPAILNDGRTCVPAASDVCSAGQTATDRRLRPRPDSVCR
jgi:hypothetical protein